MTTPTDQAANTPTLRVEGLSMGYRQSGGWLEVLEDLSFQVKQGEFLGILGPSGCGKTTLLRLVAGLERPIEGRIWLEGSPVDGPRRDVGLVFQEPTLMAWRSVESNISLPLEIMGVPEAESKRSARELTALVGLRGFEGAYPAQLSGGMAQRTALARALVHDPQLLLLDEPFGALDALTRERMAQELLRIWQARRKTVLMVTHSISEAVFLADRVLVLGPRPASVVQEVPIPLSRPRTEATLQSTAFGEVSHRLREALGVTGA
jgi:NitT/TauT family transport system ATP-binding protein